MNPKPIQPNEILSSEIPVVTTILATTRVGEESQSCVKRTIRLLYLEDHGT